LKTKIVPSTLKNALAGVVVVSSRVIGLAPEINTHRNLGSFKGILVPKNKKGSTFLVPKLQLDNAAKTLQCESNNNEFW
jgi:hypothetical protein